MKSNHTMDSIYTHWNHLPSDMTQPWLSPANSMHQSGAALDNYWGFVNGTVCLVCHLGRNQ